MKPKSDHIFLEPVDRPVTSLIVPARAEYRSKEFLSGRVVAIGPRVHQVEVGEEVAYGKDLGIEILHHDTKFVVIKPRHILAVRENNGVT
jgi:co-chaperonin GroES (HSP10)